MSDVDFFVGVAMMTLNSFTFSFLHPNNRKSLGIMDAVCKVTELVQPICFNLKILDLMCGLVSFASDSILDVVLKGD